MAKSYIFTFLDKLNPPSSMPDFENDSHIIFYNISQEGEIPLMQILMQKTMGEYHFPNFPLLLDEESDFINEIQMFGKICLETFISGNFDLNLFEYKGWHSFQNENYYFINTSLIEVTNSYMTSFDRFNFISISELIHLECFFFYTINKLNVDYIKYHISDFLLKNTDNENYSVPLIGYVMAEQKKSDFINLFGIPKQIDKEENYYKINLNINSVLSKKKNYDRNTHLGINRIALLTDSLKIVDDDSLINDELINNDAILLNNAEMNESFLIFKHFTQQIPLCSYKLR